MKLKLASALSANAVESLDDLVSPLYSKPGMRIIGIVEFAHVERNQPAPEEGKEASVTIGVKLVEVARGEQVDHLRKAMRALHIQRTARGTIDEELDELKLTKTTLDGLGDHLALRETARLRAALTHQGETLNRLCIGTFSEKELRKQLAKLHNVVTTTLQWLDDEDEDGD